MIASTVSLTWEVKPSAERMGGAGFRGFRRAGFAIVVMEDCNEFCIRKQHKISVTV